MFDRNIKRPEENKYFSGIKNRNSEPENNQSINEKQETENLSLEAVKIEYSEKEKTKNTFDKEILNLKELLNLEKNKNSDLIKINNQQTQQLQELSFRLSKFEEQDSEIEEIKIEIEQELKNLDNNLKFIADVLNAVPASSPHIEKFNLLMDEEYVAYANKNDSLIEGAAAFLKLQKIQKELQLVGNNPLLYTKNIIAVGGGFSSGKSSFINGLFKVKDIKLPRGIKPVTAIPAYVSSGRKPIIKGYSYKGGVIEISNEIFKKFTHDEIKKFGFNIKNILPYMIIDTVLENDFKNICFIDTPGYNPGTNSETDRASASEYIKQAEAVLWIISAEDGGITASDIDVLYSMLSEDNTKKLFIICNKADLKPIEDVSDICNKIADELYNNGIKYEGIMPYSSNYSYTKQNTAYSNMCKGKTLCEFFQFFNKPNVNKGYELCHDINEVFESYVRAGEAKIKYLKKQKKVLNTIKLNIFSELEKKDAEIAYYQARNSDIDGLNSDSLYDDDLDNNYDDFSKNLAEMIRDYNRYISNYVDDIKTAKKLSKNMQQCIIDLFDDTEFSNAL